MGTEKMNTVPNINNILEKIHKVNEENKIDEKHIINSKETNIKISNKTKKLQNVIPRGKPKSGRPWKEPKKKFSNIKKTIYRPTPGKKEQFRQEMKHIKELSRSIKEDRKQENERKRLRRAENAKQKLENERKSEVVQIIKNPAKLKRMKKKALRKIEKRDTNQITA